MNARVKVLQELVHESLYPVDETAVAIAIIMRASALRAVPDAPFRSHARIPRVRSFRRHNAASSFRLSSAMRLPVLPR